MNHLKFKFKVLSFSYAIHWLDDWLFQIEWLLKEPFFGWKLLSSLLHTVIDNIWPVVHTGLLSSWSTIEAVSSNAAVWNLMICNCWAKPECNGDFSTPSSMADSLSKDVSAGFLHSLHRRLSRQDWRKASQTIQTSAMLESLYISLKALVLAQREKEIWLIKWIADRPFVPYQNKGEKKRVVLIDRSLMNSSTMTTIALNLWRFLTSRIY